MTVAVFIDLETTGLNPVKEEIIEFGISVIDTTTWTQVDNPSKTMSGILLTQQIVNRVALNDLDQFIVNMHTKSGLLPRITKYIESDHPIKSYAEIETSILDKIKAWGIKGLPVWGSSVHFDRKFLEQKMPNLNEYFHYRVVDSSSDMERLKATKPGLWRLIDTDPTKYVSPPECAEHRVLEDIKHSVDLERRLAKWVTTPAAAVSDLPVVK